MATSYPQSSSPPTPVRPGGGGSRRKNRKRGKRPLSDEGRDINRQFKEAQRIANKRGLLDPLERLGTSLETSLALPFEIGPDGKPVIDPATGKPKINEAYVGNRPEEQKRFVDQLQAQVETAGKRSTEMQSLLATMQGGLAGLNAAENQGLREQAQREVDRQYQTALNQLNIAQARGGVRGAAGTAQQQNLARSRMEEQSQLEQDLLVKNIDIQDRRRSEYGGVLGEQEQSEYARKTESLGNLGDKLSELGQSEFDRAKQARAELLQKELINLGQSNTEAARLASTIFGITGYGQAERSANKQYELAQQGLAAQEKAYAAQQAAINAAAGQPTPAPTPGTETDPNAAQAQAPGTAFTPPPAQSYAGKRRRRGAGRTRRMSDLATQ